MKIVNSLKSMKTRHKACRVIRRKGRVRVRYTIVDGRFTEWRQRSGDEPVVYALEGSIAVTGSLVQWVRDNLGLIKDAPEIEDLAKEVDDNGGLFIGRRPGTAPVRVTAVARNCHVRPTMFPFLRTAVLGALATLTLACGPSPAYADEVNIYTYREAGLIKPALDAFTKATGVGVEWTTFDTGPLQDEQIAEDQESRVRHDLLMDALESLNDREKHILMERRLTDEPKTLEELSQVYDVSRERIRQIEVRAFEKLQAALLRLAGDRRLLPAA